jgi:hypothetical protein
VVRGVHLHRSTVAHRALKSACDLGGGGLQGEAGAGSHGRWCYVAVLHQHVVRRDESLREHHTRRAARVPPPHRRGASPGSRVSVE